MKKILLIVPVYNIQNSVIPDYLGLTLAAILNQKASFQVDLVVTDTVSSDSFITTLSNYLQEKKIETQFNGMVKIVHNALDPVRVYLAFNIAMRLFKNGNYDLYIYCSDDTVLTQSTDLETIIKTFEDSNAAIVSGRVDKDHIGMYTGYDMDNPYPLKVAIGENVNLHCMAFSKYFMERYDFKYMDILSGIGTESFLSFFCAAIEKDWVVCNKVKLVNYKYHHKHVKDKKDHGRTFGFMTYKNIKTFKELIEPGISVGIGFEGFRANPSHSKMLNKHAVKQRRLGKPEFMYRPDFWCCHDSNCYNENGRSKNPQKLYEYIKNNFFVSNDFLNYDILVNSVKVI